MRAVRLALLLWLVVYCCAAAWLVALDRPNDVWLLTALGVAVAAWDLTR